MGLINDIKSVFSNGSTDEEPEEVEVDTQEDSGSVCDTCGKEFETENGANIHAGQVHTEEEE